MSFSVKRVVLACLPGPLKGLAGRVENSPLGYRLARGAFWSLAGAVISRGLMLVAMIVAARILGKEGFGELGIIQSTVMMFATFAGFGLGLTATKHVAEFREKDPAKAGRIIGLSGVVAFGTGGLMSAVVIALAPWLATGTLAAPHLAPVLRLGTGMLFFSALNGAQLGALAGFEAFRGIAKASLVAGIAAFPLVLVGVWLWGLGGAVGGLVAAQAVNWVVNHVALRFVARRFAVRVRLGGCMREWRVLWRFSLPAALSGSLVGPVIWASNAMLVNTRGGYEEMGIFSAAVRLQIALTLLTATTGAPLLPMLVSKPGNTEGHIGRANVLAPWMIGTFLALPLLCFPEILAIIYGPEFGGSTPARTLVLVMCFAIVGVYKQGLARAVVTHGLMWWAVLSNGFWAVVLLLSCGFLVRFGAWGLACAFLAAYALSTIVFVPFYAYRNVVPRRTMISFDSIIVWSVIAGVATLSLLECPIAARLPVLPVAAGILVFEFLRMLRSE